MSHSISCVFWIENAQRCAQLATHTVKPWSLCEKHALYCAGEQTHLIEEIKMPKNKIPGILQNENYLERNSTGIMDRPEEQYFEFYPAGYSHKTPTGEARQDFHKSIFDRAVNNNPDVNNVEDVIFPISVDDHKIILVKDQGNPYDPHALTVYLVFDEKKYNIGHVPMKISEVIDKQFDRLSEGKVYKVREKAYGKHYSTKVVVGYDECRFLGEHTLACERLSDILDEIDEE